MNIYHLAFSCIWLFFATAVLSKQETDEIFQICIQKKDEFCIRFGRVECNKAKKALKKTITKGLKIAVSGFSGTGKSSLVNALNNCDHDSKKCDYARSCGSDECTNKAKSYQHPSIPNLNYVDLPGVGTINFPWKKRIVKENSILNAPFNIYSYTFGFSENYYEYQNLTSYDAIILLSANRPTNDEQNLYTEIHKKEPHKVVFFVRNKVNIAFEGAQYDKTSPEKILFDTRKSVRKAYNLLYGTPIYLIDAQNRSEAFRPYNDLNKLKSDIVSNLVSIAAINYDNELLEIEYKAKTAEVEAHIAFS
jgi:energy-coupling factor transporter ATP-binding protein EcfA2